MNSRDRADLKYDIVVVGGGTIGLMYALWVKKYEPNTSIAIVEKKLECGYKIGESLLSTSVRALVDIGLNFEVIRRLFGVKAGVQFWHAAAGEPQPTTHIDAVNIEETFQVERRVLEIALLRLAEKRGIDLFMGTRFNFDESKLEQTQKELVCQTEAGNQLRFEAPILCDASGPSSLVARKKGLYSKDMSTFDTFNTNVYFGYYTKNSDVPLAHWNYPATSHICFPEGWTWFIDMVSWQQSKYSQLEDMIHHLLDLPDHDEYPTRANLAEQFDCSYEPITSIGFTVRDDQDSADVKGLTPQEKFYHYVDKYPGVKFVMDHYDPIDDLYKKGTPFSGFSKIAHYSREVVGDGLCIVGDAAMLTNPLFSHGINYGSGTAYTAAMCSVQALRSHSYGQETFQKYQDYFDQVHPILVKQTDMLYRSFQSAETYEKVLKMVFYFGSTDVVQRQMYSPTDPVVFDLLNPEWVSRVEEISRLQKHDERSGVNPGKTAKTVSRIVDGFVKDIITWPSFRSQDVNQFFSHYNQHGERIESRKKRKGITDFHCCTVCGYFYADFQAACPTCGMETPKLISQSSSSYWCSQCARRHHSGSEIGQSHFPTDAHLVAPAFFSFG